MLSIYIDIYISSYKYFNQAAAPDTEKKKEINCEVPTNAVLKLATQG